MAGRGLGVMLLAVVTTAACSGDGESDSTLAPLSAPGAATVAPTAAAPTSSAPAPPSSGAASMGWGFVSIQVRLAASGVDEAITLDRATVPVHELDPISVDAFCTPLDDGTGWMVSVTDLRRLSAGHRLVSAVLRIDEEVAAPGVYDGTLEVGDAGQKVTGFTGPITVGEGLAAGSFDLRDATGQAATGSFVCAPEPVATTTVPAATVEGSVPGGSGPPATTTGAPAGPAPPTVPEATS
jgi:hypothetical protein